MTSAKIALLEDRGVVAVTGEDAYKFLQGLITNDLESVGEQGEVFAALLTPQGKILFDFIVLKGLNNYCFIDVARDQSDALVKRLSMYKLRAKVEIENRSSSTRVGAAQIWNDDLNKQFHFPDPRDTRMGMRFFIEEANFREVWPSGVPSPSDEADYHAHRISLGVPEGGKDFAWGEVFPHEANMDMLNGVSFTKGCYVGQELVSRMEHRGTARRRIIRVMTGEAALPPAGTEVKAGDVTVGAMGSSAGSYGLAMLRLDRVAEFAAKGVPLTAAGVIITPDSSDLARLSPRPESAAP